ncbi:putative kinesin [Neospora caninum Liverpool]|uniref:Kinesin, putative n=1 Tax=Neospora caninum (strain Liverpool) TaxID=572307 RepID=F0VPY1_NEOCL|nr:putative kinesin [Neospora caninum Liverpool]CBZ55778.1 putative kinesin [Neospora caninum Liverpool]CEL70522.1 TPA: kinesin, putative [Neospora caninum Liverpool]|eukprot:XP_003885804.1 putative kinesin [Neospora caninum Liverpool]
MSSVKVAVRVRPFNDREKTMNARLCIEMNGKSTTITNVDDEKQSRTFSFDYSYWSHDGFVNDGSGYSRPVSSKYADQEKVFNDIGKDVLNNAFEGYNACLFAYGQTGSGKSYSMVGYGANKGIVVRACEEIFERIKSIKDPLLRSEVTVSMLEIYNEAVQDLLVKPEQRPKGGLKIRHTPQLGTFVQDLTKHPVDTYAAIQAKLDEGTSNRTVGATLMNATSSRAHTVLQIVYNQVTLDENTKEPLSQKTAEISLVDLAGSERAGSTGATGDRLKEGCAINQSLSALGNVISALADKACGKLKPGQVIPYRDSALTRILQSALGGNSKTCMIAALSPASVNYEETLSTLRYADRVKSIKNEAVVNENPLERLIRELKAENERLKKAAGGELVLADTGKTQEEMDKMKQQYEEELEANRRALEEMSKSWQQKLAEAQARDAAAGKEALDENQPCLKNLNEDPFLSGKITLNLPVGSSTVGKSSSEMKPTFQIGGLGVVVNHATLTCAATGADGSAFEVKLRASGKTLINGEALAPEEERTLSHRDRILFGHANLFIYIDPAEADRSMPSWEEAMKEANKQSLDEYGDTVGLDAVASAKLREMEAKMQEEREKMEREKREWERRVKDKEAQMVTAEGADAVALMKQFEEERRQHELELEKKQKELDEKLRKLSEEQEEEKKTQEAEHRARVVLEEILTRTIMLIEEANSIAEELGIGVFFSPKLTMKHDGLDISRKGTATNVMQQTEIQIRVERLDTDVVEAWKLDLFEQKIFDMREVYNQYMSSAPGEFKRPEGADDPFASDPDSYQVLGQAYLYLDFLFNLLPVENEALPIFDFKGQKQGTLTISINLELLVDMEEASKKGPQVTDLDYYDTVEDIKGKMLKVTVKVDSAQDLRENCCRRPEVNYKWIDGVSEVRCSTDDLCNKNPAFKSVKEFDMMITDEVVGWFRGVLVFEVAGMMVSKQHKEQATPSSPSASSVAAKLREKEVLLAQIEKRLHEQGTTLDAFLSGR